jgi:hypothetical protein
MKSFQSFIFTSAGFLLISAASAFAQAPGQRIVIEQGASPARQEGLVRVQSSVNFFLPGQSGDGEEAQKLRDRARSTVYEMAAHECDLLRSVLAKDCRMEGVTVNISGGRQFNAQQPDGYNINGTVSLQISLK